MRYCEKDLVKIAKRENNTKRNYLVVNPLQGKHIPVTPSRALELFENLGKELEGKYMGERLLLIGFAETATAIGAQVAISLGTKYMQTTREMIPDVAYLFFSESHSHATEQKLVKDDIDAIIDDIDRIIFVEDEVTTGNTIMNIVRIIRKEYSGTIKFAVASLLNGMTEKYLDIYRKEEIALHYLVKTNHSDYGEIAEAFLGNGTYIEADMTERKEIESILISAEQMNARRLVNAREYSAVCQKFANELKKKIKITKGEKILVLGSEEFMYPALYVGKELEDLGCDVKCHATTRSPIAVSREQKYPLHCRYSLVSLYDSNRTTYIYDIGEYDAVIILTDSELSDQRGINTLVNALKIKNDKILVVRWC